MQIGQATGLQIAFLMYAVMLVAVPVTAFVVEVGALDGAFRALAEKGAHFALACTVIVAFPRLRRFASQALSTPIPRSMRGEVAFVALAKLLLAFAAAAGIALWFWITQGPERAEAVVGHPDKEIARAFSDAGLVRLLLAVLVAPIVEEVVFRGFIHRAFERQWGWFASTMATSALFGLYHPHFLIAFASSVVYVSILRRTGSLRAPIIVHTLFNLMLWWPLLGQHVFPPSALPGDPSGWGFHLACLAFTAIALPSYVWMSRDRNVLAPTAFLEPHAALPK